MATRRPCGPETNETCVGGHQACRHDGLPQCADGIDILPLVHRRGEFLRDDVTDFLLRPGANPPGVNDAALGAYVGGWISLFRKIDGFRHEAGQLDDP